MLESVKAGPKSHKFQTLIHVKAGQRRILHHQIYVSYLTNIVTYTISYMKEMIKSNVLSLGDFGPGSLVKGVGGLGSKSEISFILTYVVALLMLSLKWAQ